MKKFVLTLALIISLLLSYTSINANNNKSFSIDFIEQTSNDTFQNNNIIVRDCTVRLDFELDDGTTVQGEITFSDVSWWECTKMQFAAWWERNF